MTVNEAMNVALSEIEQTGDLTPKALDALDAAGCISSDDANLFAQRRNRIEAELGGPYVPKDSYDVPEKPGRYQVVEGDWSVNCESLAAAAELITENCTAMDEVSILDLDTPVEGDYSLKPFFEVTRIRNKNDDLYRATPTLSILEKWFPWLVEDDGDVSGADTVDQLTLLYERLKSEKRP